jgi:hypothetical protein
MTVGFGFFHAAAACPRSQGAASARHCSSTEAVKYKRVAGMTISRV